MMQNLKLVIFDLDGTLVDAYEAIFRSFNHTMKALGLKNRSRLTVRKAVGRGDGLLLKPFVEPEFLNEALRIYRRHHSFSLIKYARLFPGARKVLRALKKRGLKLAVASNRPTRYSWILIRHLELHRYFDYVLCADRLAHRKPHPEILKNIMNFREILSSECSHGCPHRAHRDHPGGDQEMVHGLGDRPFIPPSGGHDGCDWKD